MQILLHGDIAVDRAGNDMLMACPVGAEVALEQSVGGRSFLYRFDRAVPGKGAAALGAFHGLEIRYVFHAFTVRGWRWLPFTETDRKLSAAIETYWTNFAKFGDPNSAALPTWKPWNGNDEPYLEFTPSGDVLPLRNFSPPFCRLAPQGLKERLLE